ncbi:MAG: hypothetical protein JJU29_11270 [Verrucomicrobia bacterium]|nr:hypothetical protein [Verrucomicrobiota bacterium]MCH8512838.1 hypothetical protein [Kiritimatiellia bacterium]
MSKRPFLSAYYFRAHLYTQVPRHVREDLRWMADCGTNAVVLGILEQDLTAAVENVDLICREARALGMEVWLTPSRWGNLVAGCPKVPCLYTALHPEIAALQEDGSIWYGGFGPYASVHHPAVFEFFAKSMETMLRLWPVSGIIWDELKALYVVDHSPSAKEAMGESIADPVAHLRAQADFFGRVNAHALSVKPDLKTAAFIYGHCPPDQIQACAAISPLHAFGCDGRPWHRADGGMDDNGSGGAPSKFLLDQGAEFIRAAREQGKEAYALIENHALPASCHELVRRRLPEVFAQGWDHLTYYYYPRSCEAPDAAMAVFAEALRALSSAE